MATAIDVDHYVALFDSKLTNLGTKKSGGKVIHSICWTSENSFAFVGPDNF